MKLLRLVSVLIVLSASLLLAMEKEEKTKQERREWVYRNAVLGRFLCQTHPEVVTWVHMLGLNCTDSVTPISKKIIPFKWAEWPSVMQKASDEISEHKYSCSISPDGASIAIGSTNGGVYVIDALDGTCTHKLLECLRGTVEVSWSNDGCNIAAGDGSGNVVIWNIRDNNSRKLSGNPTYVRSIAWSPDSDKVAVGFHCGTIRLWDNKGNFLREIENNSHYAIPICWSSDGSLLISGSWQRIIRIWDVLTGKCLKELYPEKGNPSVNYVGWNAHEKTISALCYETLYRWSTKDFCECNDALSLLSVAQQNFLISLYNIHSRRHDRRPLIILPGTNARNTFETLPSCLQKLLLQTNCVRLNHSWTQQIMNAVYMFIGKD